MWFSTSVGIGLDFVVVAALLRVRVVERVRTSWIVAALWVRLRARRRNALDIGVEARRRPEHVVVNIEHVFLGDVVDGELSVTFAERSSTGSLGVFADWSSAVSIPSQSVFDKFADAELSVSHSGALLAVLVLFADRVQLVDRRPVAGIGHWPVAEDETLAAVRPVLSLVEVGVVILHLGSELLVPPGVLVWSLAPGSGQRRVRGGRGEKKEGRGVLHGSVSVSGSI